jgi:exodeoxyribonuclease VII small subunit
VHAPLESVKRVAKHPPLPSAARPDFEQALAELEAVVRALEEGDLGLNEALARYEQGIKFLRQCHELLQKAERRIELLSGVDAEGRPITAPFEEPELSLDEKSRQRSRRRSSAASPPGSLLFPLEEKRQEDQPEIDDAGESS